MPSFDASAPCLILAPHLVYPARNGSDISLDRMGACFSAYVPYVDLICEQHVVRFEDGAEVGRQPFANAMRSKHGAAVRTLVRRSHFYLEKFLTPRYAQQARSYLQDPVYKTVLYSYLTTTALVDPTEGLFQERVHLVWSHNDEFKWFQDLRRSSSNPLGRRVASQSEQWLHTFFRRHGRDFTLLHVTEQDRDGFAQYYPDHASLIVPIGVDLASEMPPPLPPDTARIRLLFVGALGVRMNFDALSHFAERFVPVLRAGLGDALEVVVVGSQPSAAVEGLCRAQGWALHPNASEAELDALFERALFSVLPFNYATGAKLKLLNSLAHAVPFLATTRVSAQAEACSYPSLLSDDPAAWLERIEAVRQQGLSGEVRAALRGIAERHSWAASAERLRAYLATTLVSS